MKCIEAVKAAFDQSDGQITRFKEFTGDFEKLNTPEVKGLFSSLDLENAKQRVFEQLNANAQQLIDKLEQCSPVSVRAELESLLASGSESLRQWALDAKRIGFTAAKLEVTVTGPYAHSGLDEPPESIVDVVADCREAVGSDFVLMLDVQYSWSNARQALRIVRRLEPYDLFFLETPLAIDDLDGYAYLHDHGGVRIAAGEWQTTRFEFIDLMDRAKLDLVQPDVGRVGGLTEAKRVSDLAGDRGRLVVPHCWKTGVGIAASVHLAAATAHCPYVEFLPPSLCESALRRELVTEDLTLKDGRLQLPTKPGLGIELNREALERFRA